MKQYMSLSFPVSSVNSTVPEISKNVLYIFIDLYLCVGNKIIDIIFVTVPNKSLYWFDIDIGCTRHLPPFYDALKVYLFIQYKLKII